jgi:hypothetical protein
VDALDELDAGQAGHPGEPDGHPVEADPGAVVAARVRDPCVGQLPAPGQQLGEGHVAAVVGVDVEADDVGRHAQPDVARPFAGPDLGFGEIRAAVPGAALRGRGLGAGRQLDRMPAEAQVGDGDVRGDG